MNRARAAEIFSKHKLGIYTRTDRLFGKLFLLEYILGIIGALWISPKAWQGAESAVHIHVIGSILIGAAIIGFPLFLIRAYPGRPITRHVIAASQMLISALWIHLSGGRIETHFHIFGSLAFLAFYRDWRVLITASLVVVIDHVVRGFYWPVSVYGAVSVDNWRWLEHSGWVLFEDIFLFLAIRQSTAEMQAIAERQTDAEEIEAELTKAKARAEEASETKSAFLANMSHEIRTPLGAILGFAQLIADDKNVPQESQAHVKTILRNGDQLFRVINDILDISKVEANKIEVERIRFDLKDLMNDVIVLLSLKSEEKGLGLVVSSGSPLPSTIVSDPVRFKQILMNVIGNAIKFTRNGQIAVEFNLRNPGSTEACRLEVRVKDTGPGIAADKAAGLFQPFAQADTATTRKFGGTGLGLYLSKRLAQALGGDLILAASVPGQGSEFLISIHPGQIVAEEIFRRIKPNEQMIRAEFRKTPSGDLTGVRVLVVDDSPDNVELAARFLRAAGAEVESDGSAEKALDRLRQRSFDVVLMDIQMPELDGYGAVARLRGELKYFRPVVALTAHAMRGERERCLDAGFDAYLSKPIDRQALIQVTAKYADIARAGGQTNAPQLPDERTP